MEMVLRVIHKVTFAFSFFSAYAQIRAEGDLAALILTHLNVVARGD